jgi:hypothetical protein
MVVSDLLLFGVEAHALSDDCLWLTMTTPYGERELEADGQDALGDFIRALAKGMRGTVEARWVGRIGRVVPPHVEALHLGRRASSARAVK